MGLCRLQGSSAIPGESAQTIPQKVCRRSESLPLRGRWHFAAGKMTEGVSTSAAYPCCQPRGRRPAVLPLHRGGFLSLCEVRLPPVKGFAFHHPPRGGGLLGFVQTLKDDLANFGESAQTIPQKVCRKPESLPLRGRWHFAAGKMTEGVSTSAAYPCCQPRGRHRGTNLCRS